MLDFGALVALVPPEDVVYVMAVFGICGAIDAWLPATSQDSRWYGVRRVISIVGQNYRNAANVTKVP